MAVFQVASCDEQDMFLIYPRSYEEMAYIWRLFKQLGGPSSFLTYSLALGLNLQNVDHESNKATYSSVDDKLVLTSPEVSWFVSDNTTGLPLLEPIVHMSGLQVFTPEAGAKLASYQEFYAGISYMCFYDL